MLPQIILLTILRFTENLVNFIDLIFSISNNDEEFLETMEFLNHTQLYKNRKWMHDVGALASNYQNTDEYSSRLYVGTGDLFADVDEHNATRKVILTDEYYRTVDFTNVIFTYLHNHIVNYSFTDAIHSMTFNNLASSIFKTTSNQTGVYGFIEATSIFISEDIKQLFKSIICKEQNKLKYGRKHKEEDDNKINKLINELNLKFKSLFEKENYHVDFSNSLRNKNGLNSMYIDFYIQSILSNVNIKYDTSYDPFMIASYKVQNYDDNIRNLNLDNTEDINHVEDEYVKEDVHISNKNRKSKSSTFPKKEKRAKYSSTRTYKKHYKQHLKRNIDFKVCKVNKVY